MVLGILLFFLLLTFAKNEIIFLNSDGLLVPLLSSVEPAWYRLELPPKLSISFQFQLLAGFFLQGTFRVGKFPRIEHQHTTGAFILKSGNSIKDGAFPSLSYHLAWEN